MSEPLEIHVMERVKNNLPLILIGFVIALLGLLGFIASTQGYMILFLIIGVGILISGIYKILTPGDGKQTIPAPETVQSQ